MGKIILGTLLSLAGAFAGWSLKPAATGQPHDDTILDQSSPARTSSSRVQKPVASTLRSSDSFQTIVEMPLDTNEAFRRLALWLLDASSEEIAAYWDHYQHREDKRRFFTDLLFISWTRVDPEGAIAAVKNTKNEQFAWWAWGCHEPEKAMEAADRRNKFRINVAWAMVEFHAEWLRENFDSLAAPLRNHALSGYLKRHDTLNPKESIEFLIKQNRTISGTTLLAYARQDPAAAYEIAKQLDGSDNQYKALNKFFDELQVSEPDLLAKIEETTSSIADRNQIRLRQFRSTLAEDPESAYEIFRNSPNSSLRDEQLALLGSHYLRNDPEKAFQIFAENLQKGNLDQSRTGRVIRTDGGGSSWSGHSGGLSQFAEHIAKQFPQRAVELAAEKERSLNQGFHRNSFFDDFANIWAEQDLHEFSNWVTSQQDTPNYEKSASVLIRRLNRLREHEAALQWAQTFSNVNDHHSINTYRDWLRADPEAAAAWRLSEQFEGDPRNFPLPEELKSENNR